MIGHHAQHCAVLQRHQQLAVGGRVFLGGVAQLVLKLLKGQVAAQGLGVFRQQGLHLRHVGDPVCDLHGGASVVLVLGTVYQREAGGASGKAHNFGGWFLCKREKVGQIAEKA